MSSSDTVEGLEGDGVIQPQTGAYERVEVNAQENEELEDDNLQSEEVEEFNIKKRKKKSFVWNDFKEVEVGGIKKAKCNHCNQELALNKGGTTTGFIRHRDKCVQRRINLKMAEKQTKLNFMPSDESSLAIPPLHPGKFDMEVMRESAAHWVMMHEHPFSIMEEVGFNIMMKRGMPEWQKVSRTTSRADCVKIYELEKKKLKKNLELVSKISLTTDCWKSKNQKILPYFEWSLKMRIMVFKEDTVMVFSNCEGEGEAAV